MDPISALFAGFLQSGGETISQAAINGMNAEPQTVVVDYQGQRISFTHQLWRIRPESVCADQRARLADYAPCTQAAKALFEQACDTLRDKAGAPAERAQPEPNVLQGGRRLHADPGPHPVERQHPRGNPGRRLPARQSATSARGQHREPRAR